MRSRILVVAWVAFAIALVAGSPRASALESSASVRTAPSTLPSTEEMLDTIRELTAYGPRRVGTPGAEYAVDYVARKFRSYGLSDVHVELSPTYSWEARRHGLRFDGSSIDASPAVYTQSPSRTAVGTTSTPRGGLRAPIVDLGMASPAEIRRHDVEGKIVLFDLEFLLPLAGLAPFMEFLWDPGATLVDAETLLTANPFITNFTDSVEAAMAEGAVGFIGVLGDYFDSNRYYNEFYRRLVVTIPGMWVTKAEGARLRALLAANPEGSGEMVLRTRRERVPAHVVVGYLEGRSSDTIMVQSHHDSGFAGAVEDASGVAEVLALAKHYAAQPASSREKSLMFTTFDSHWSGYQAHFAFVRRHITRRDPVREPHKIVANVTLEHIGKAASVGDHGSLEVSELPEPRGVFENLAPTLKTAVVNAVVKHDLRRTAVLNASPFQLVGTPTDSSPIVVAGVPTASLISGPLYLYDAADTLNKVARGELRPVASAFVDVVDAIDETPSPLIGLLPAPAGDPLGAWAIENLGGERGTERSRDARPCRAARTGPPIELAQLRRERRQTVLTFRARRRATASIVAGTRGESEVVRRSRALEPCRWDRLTMPRSVTRARVIAHGRAASVRLWTGY